MYIILYVANQTCPCGHWKCPNSDRCVGVDYFCDGVDDCGDNRDEDIELCRKSTVFRLLCYDRLMV